LQLNANEVGMSASTDTVAAPGKGGLKLRVECSGSHTGKVKLMALAGDLTT
jgi:hypothetical protein